MGTGEVCSTGAGWPGRAGRPSAVSGNKCVSGDRRYRLVAVRARAAAAAAWVAGGPSLVVAGGGGARRRTSSGPCHAADRSVRRASVTAASAARRPSAGRSGHVLSPLAGRRRPVPAAVLAGGGGRSAAAAPDLAAPAAGCRPAQRREALVREARGRGAGPADVATGGQWRRARQSAAVRARHQGRQPTARVRCTHHR